MDLIDSYDAEFNTKVYRYSYVMDFAPSAKTVEMSSIPFMRLPYIANNVSSGSSSSTDSRGSSDYTRRGSMCEWSRQRCQFRGIILPYYHGNVPAPEIHLGLQYDRRMSLTPAASQLVPLMNIAPFTHNRIWNSSFDMGKPQLTADDFESGRLLGRGGFGEVKAVKYKRTGTAYACKRYARQDSGLALFQCHYEHNLMVRLRQCNARWALPLVGSFESSKHLNLITELCVYGNLHSVFTYLVRRDRINRKIVQFYAYEALLALQELHSHGIVHRDVKLDNFMVRDNGHLYLGDFGGAIYTSNVDSRLNTVDIWGTYGTEGYHSPEMYTLSDYDARTDYWSYAIMFLEVVFSGWNPLRDTVTALEKQYVEDGSESDLNKTSVNIAIHMKACQYLTGDFNRDLCYLADSFGGNECVSALGVHFLTQMIRSVHVGERFGNEPYRTQHNPDRKRALPNDARVLLSHPWMKKARRKFGKDPLKRKAPLKLPRWSHEEYFKDKYDSKKPTKALPKMSTGFIKAHQGFM
ncbi:hypothetical protein CANCADRAFT_32885 [Tortispora caseinolytica NRRL Y-17796]|uniref:non-specific serine/threonine protein kinase n=1 Tax=Tortispora caseinolytica NRRL Y-17796 TaxID=767744 RepID=A0A1E4TD83_9ASCO|nr:hypothetical protein CANCADRAFT_32885 [Tortispora caseinolytica NRRL Y-17796]